MTDMTIRPRDVSIESAIQTFSASETGANEYVGGGTFKLVPSSGKRNGVLIQNSCVSGIVPTTLEVILAPSGLFDETTNTPGYQSGIGSQYGGVPFYVVPPGGTLSLPVGEDFDIFLYTLASDPYVSITELTGTVPLFLSTPSTIIEAGPAASPESAIMLNTVSSWATASGTETFTNVGDASKTSGCRIIVKWTPPGAGVGNATLRVRVFEANDDDTYSTSNGPYTMREFSTLATVGTAQMRSISLPPGKWIVGLRVPEYTLTNVGVTMEKYYG